jgi:hypothetical protein
MPTSNRRWGRRAFLETMGSAALALPMLEALAPRRARADATKTAKRLILFYVPNGIDHLAFWPSGGERDFTLSPQLQALAPYRDKLVIVGPQFSSPSSRQPILNTGLTYVSRPQTHQSHVATTGDIIKFPYQPQMGSGLSGNTGGPSIDQLIASQLPVKTRFPSLECGVYPVGGDTPSTINFALDGSPLPRMTDPTETWMRVFADVAGAGTGGAPAPAMKRRMAVADFLNRRFAGVAPRLGTADRQLLQHHMDALKQTEDRLLTVSTTGAACPVSSTKLAAPDMSAPYADVPMLTENFVDIISLAFACDLTRVASLTLGYPGGGGNGGIRPVWLGFNDAHHGLSHHGGDPTKRGKFNKYVTWVVGEVARLLGKLAASPTATGTLLDETLVYFYFRHSDGNIHGNSNLPVVLAGGAGGYFGQMGRFLNLPKTNPSSLLITVAAAMGVKVDAFGVGPCRTMDPLPAVIA